MKNILCLAVLSAILLFNTRLSAQTADPQLRISGMAADSLTRDSVSFATVTLKKPNEQTGKVIVSKANGYFEFTNLQPARYEISVSSAGYSNKTISVDLSDTSRKVADVGFIFLGAKTKALQAVNVAVARPVVKQEADRIIYDLLADPDSRSSSVLDMMRKIPFLSVDANNNILLKGSGSYRIFINGRPSGMLTNNPKEILKSMPASTITRIEVITNPPVRYDAEGLAGIINIILDKKTSDGYNGNVNVTAGFPQGGPGTGGSVNIKKGKLGISVYGGGNLNRLPATSVINTRNTFTPITVFTQEGFTKSNTSTVYGGGELSIEIDSIHLITGAWNLYANKTTGNNYQHSFLKDQAQVVEGYTYDNTFTTKGNGIDAALNYQRGFKNDKNKLLTFSYNLHNNIANPFNTVLITNRVNYTGTDYQQFNEGRALEHTGQVDYIQAKKNLTIEAGVKAIFRTNKSNYQHFVRDPNSNSFKQVDHMSDIFKNTQHVYGIYNSYNYNLSKWSLRGGFRIEQTVLNADFISTSTTVHQNYVHVIPSVAVRYKLKGNSNLNFGFSRRIRRPGIYKLNPYVDRSNPNFEYTGNPELQPSTVNTLLLGYGFSKKINFNAGAGYSFFNKLDFKIAEFNPVTNITRSTFKNIGKGYALNLDININCPISKQWHAGLNSSMAYIHADGANFGTVIKLDNFIYNLNFSSAYKFNHDWRVSGSMNWAGPNVISLQSTSSSFISSGFTVTKELMKAKLSLSASVNNPFMKYRKNKVITSGSNFFETNIVREYSRYHGISVSYRFGNLKGEIKKNKRGIKNTDVGNKSGLQ